MEIKLSRVGVETPAQVFSCKICEICKNIFLLENTSGGCSFILFGIKMVYPFKIECERSCWEDSLKKIHWHWLIFILWSSVCLHRVIAVIKTSLSVFQFFLIIVTRTWIGWGNIQPIERPVFGDMETSQLICNVS